VTDGKELAFTEARTYPDGTEEFCAAMLELKDGKAEEQGSARTQSARV
jgi:hypothetical protein